MTTDIICKTKGSENNGLIESSLGLLKGLSVVTWKVSITKRWEAKDLKSGLINKLTFYQTFKYIFFRLTISRSVQNVSVSVSWRNLLPAGTFLPVFTLHHNTRKAKKPARGLGLKNCELGNSWHNTLSSSGYNYVRWTFSVFSGLPSSQQMRGVASSAEMTGELSQKLSGANPGE